MGVREFTSRGPRRAVVSHRIQDSQCALACEGQRRLLLCLCGRRENPTKTWGALWAGGPYSPLRPQRKGTDFLRPNAVQASKQEREREREGTRAPDRMACCSSCDLSRMRTRVWSATKRVVVGMHTRSLGQGMGHARLCSSHGRKAAPFKPAVSLVCWVRIAAFLAGEEELR